MNRVSSALAGVVAHIQLDGRLRRTLVEPIRIVSQAQGRDNTLLQRLLMALPIANRTGEIAQWSARNNRFPVAHGMQQGRPSQEHERDNPYPYTHSQTTHSERSFHRREVCARPSGSQTLESGRQRKSPSRKIREKNLRQLRGQNGM